MTRLRIRFAKLGKIRWTSHRDTARMWERAFRRVSLPLAYTQGFSPRPRVSFGLALPTGYESVAEYLDVELASEYPPEGADVAALSDRLSAALPLGVDVVAAATSVVTASLQEEVTACTWRLSVVSQDQAAAAGAGDIGDRVNRLLDTTSLVVTRQRKGKGVTEDIRPGIKSLRLLEMGLTEEDQPGVWLECDLATQPRALRPSELVAALGTDLEARDVRRMHQWIERPGARWEPLTAPLVATGAPHASERAS